jgi:hypothetical protein
MGLDSFYFGFQVSVVKEFTKQYSHSKGRVDGEGGSKV